MDIYIRNGMRFNPYAKHKVGGVEYAEGQLLAFPEVMASEGIIKISEPEAPEGFNYDFWIRTELESAPYVVYEKRPDDEIAAILLARAKAKRQETVNALTVTTSTGKVFDGNEPAQDRLSRAILVAGITGLTECVWVLADNTPTTVTLDELKEALSLSVQAIGAVWAEPYL